MGKTMCHHFSGIWFLCNVFRCFKFAPAALHRLMWNPKKVLTGTVWNRSKIWFFYLFRVAIQKVAQVDALGFTLGKFPSFIPQTSCNKWIEWMLLGSFGFTSGAFFSYSPILLIMVISLFLILLIMGGMLVIDEPLILCWYSFLLFMLNYIPYDSPWLQNMLGLQKLWCPWWLYPQQWWCTHWELQGIVWGFQSQGTPKTWVSTINWSNDLDDLG